MNKNKDLCDDIKMISRPKGIYDKLIKKKSKKLLEEAETLMMSGMQSKAHNDLNQSIYYLKESIFKYEQYSAELLKEVNLVVEDINFCENCSKSYIGCNAKENCAINQLKSALEKLENK